MQRGLQLVKNKLKCFPIKIISRYIKLHARTLSTLDETNLRRSVNYRSQHHGLSYLVGYIKRIVVRREPYVCLFLAVGPDQRVHLSCLHVVKLLHRIFDVALRCANVDEEHQRVMLLYFFHR